jgi:hypothetical protein
MAVRTHRAQDPVCVWTPLDAVCAGMRWQGEDTLLTFWIPNLDRPIPG